jgi:site-specific DNA recombinase
MKAVIYARYSSDKQRASSIADQVRNCEQYANQNDLRIISIYSDEAVSGSVRDREGYQRMLNDGRNGTFEVLLVDDLSRLSRNDIEMKRVIQDFSFRRIRIVGVSEGYVSTAQGSKIFAGMKGLMNEMYLDDLRDKTHRGMSGQAIKGYNCGGRTYGYRNVPIEDGRRLDAYGRPAILAVKYEIHEEQAAWVKKIFEWWVSGKSYRSIAFQLNALGVPSSRGTTWAISAVKVILENDMYRGQVIWNRKQWVKDPDTGKRLYRKRPESEWIITPAPELEIISPALWEASIKRRPQNYDRSKATPNQRYLFSGLLACGECGASFAVATQGRFGCSNYHRRGKTVCKNGITISRHIVEEKLLGGLKEHLMSDEMYELFNRTVNELLAEPAEQIDRLQIARQLKKAEKEHQNLLSAIKRGIYTDSIQSELQAAEKRMTELNEQLTSQPPAPKKRILPKAKERFQAAIRQLESTLVLQAYAARELLKQLIEGKILMHNRGDFLEAEIHAKTPEFLMKSVGYDSGFMVAGAGFEPTTFRL